MVSVYDLRNVTNHNVSLKQWYGMVQAYSLKIPDRLRLHKIGVTFLILCLWRLIAHHIALKCYMSGLALALLAFIFCQTGIHLSYLVVYMCICYLQHIFKKCREIECSLLQYIYRKCV